ncbi:hypothetical protein AB0L57_00935 [Nocardia sp. NPDC052254]|uniref:hypothetical protein n=1 Tax=Nocardia sp. NPDC052254 TaxID=3155681 RepID=UPI0034401F3B
MDDELRGTDRSSSTILGGRVALDENGFIGFPRSVFHAAGATPGHLSDEPHWVTETDAGRNVVVGTVHRSNPRHPQAVALHRVVDQWLDRTDGTLRAMLFEGGARRTARKVYGDADAAMRDGEMAWGEYLADQHGVAKVSLEEHPRDQVRGLLANGTAPDMLFFHHVMRMIPQAVRRGENIDSRIAQTIDQNSFILGPALDGRTGPLGDASERFRSLLVENYAHRDFPRDFRSDDEAWILREQADVLVDPAAVENPSPLQKVAFAVHQRRQQYMVDILNGHLDDGYSILALYGQTHMPYVLPHIHGFTGADTVPLTA